jgi:hypothetical protein
MTQEVKFEIGKATDFSVKEISAFKKIVVNAGEVGSKTFDGLMKKNPTLLFIPNTINIEAIGALKIPNDSYKTKVFKISKSSYSPDEFEYELGWIVSLKEGKGNGKKLVEILTTTESTIYATVRKENKRMKHILQKLGFESNGQQYKSKRDEYDLELYIRKKKNTL